MDRFAKNVLFAGFSLLIILVRDDCCGESFLKSFIVYSSFVCAVASMYDQCVARRFVLDIVASYAVVGIHVCALLLLNGAHRCTHTWAWLCVQLSTLMIFVALTFYINRCKQ